MKVLSQFDSASTAQRPESGLPLAEMRPAEVQEPRRHWHSSAPKFANQPPDPALCAVSSMSVGAGTFRSKLLKGIEMAFNLPCPEESAAMLWLGRSSVASPRGL